MFCKVYRDKIGIGPGIPYVLDRSKPGEKLPDDPQDTDVIKTSQVHDTQRRVNINGPFFLMDNATMYYKPEGHEEQLG